MSNNKFESLLELLINEENDKAEALFHEIVVEKSRDIYENLADEEVTAEAMHDKKMKKEDEVTETEASDEAKVEETAEEKVEETTEEAKDEEVKETSEESKEDQVDEVAEIEDEAKESETTEEESIEEVGGDATDELVKDISADEEGAKEMNMDMEMDKDMDKDMDGDKGDEDMEDRVVDLEDALDELKAEFEAMMGDKKDDKEEKEDESLEVAPELTPEVEMESKKADEAMHKDKKKMSEYKNPVSADTADHSDSGKSPIGTANKPLNSANAKSLNQGQADSGERAAPTAQKMGEFENSPGKAKGTSMKKEVKPATADGSDKSAKSPVISRK